MKWNKPDEFTIVKLADVEIYDISTDQDSYGGCRTCDYGSEYIVTLEFSYFTNDETWGKFTVSSNDMYEYRFNTGGLISFIISNLDNFKEMTLEEFKEFWKSLCEKSSTQMTDEELSAFNMIKAEYFYG